MCVRTRTRNSTIPRHPVLDARYGGTTASVHEIISRSHSGLAFRIRYAGTVSLRRSIASVHVHIVSLRPPRRSTPTLCLTRHHQRPRLQVQAHRGLPESARRHRSSSYTPLRPPPRTRRSPATRQHHTKQKTTSPLSPTGRLWDHPPLKGWSRRSAPPQKTNPPNPPPVGKAGFEVWVFTKGGLVCTSTCRSDRTVGSHHPIVHAHHVGRYAEP